MSLPSGSGHLAPPRVGRGPGIGEAGGTPASSAAPSPMPRPCGASGTDRGAWRAHTAVTEAGAALLFGAAGLSGVASKLRGVRRRRGGRGAGGRARRLVVLRVGGAEATWEAGAQDERECASEAEYLERVAAAAAPLPEGFRVGTARLQFSPAEVEGKTLPMDLSLIHLDEPTDAYAAVFTTNAFPGSPVLVGRRRLAARKPLQAVVVNNKISNVFPAGDGEAASEAVCAGAAEALGLAGGAESVLPSSTGIIGWGLPTKEMLAAMPEAAAALQAESLLPFARGIMTTDRYAKVSAATLPGGARLVGCAKGAGMIEPHMATMLCFLLTDAALPYSPEEMQKALAEAVGGSFNAISVDGDESTSDTVALLSSRRKPCDDTAAFAAALRQVCRDLAAQVVRNGEGTEHVIRVSVSGASDDAEAVRIGRAVVNGPLFKSAVAGNDPNVGRLVGKVGQALGASGSAAAAGCVCTIGGETIFEGGKFTLDSEREHRLSAHLRAAVQDTSLAYPPHGRVVDVGVRLGGGGAGSAVVLGSDLTKEYVEINADYRS